MTPNSIFCYVLVWMMVNIHGEVVWGQDHNGEIYRELVAEFLKEKGHVFSVFEGSVLREWTPNYAFDSTQQVALRFSEPRVSYTFLKEKKVRREVLIPLSWKDSSLRATNLRHVDTLSREATRMIHKQSPKNLKGDAPSLRAKYLRPILVITMSVGALVTLFYTRSN